MNQPLVTIICVCYNHAQFVTEALDSAINQNYKNIELIVIDDGSTDGSGKVIKRWVANHPHTMMLLNGSNLGYCKTFNKALQFAKGEYIIDLAADDMLMPERVEVGLKLFERKGPQCGIVFSDAQYVDAQGNFLRLHSSAHPHDTILQGDVFKEVIERYFICSPTMMIRREVLKVLNGYDEALAFEDFDLWIRASREFHFYYSPEVLVKKRVIDSSLSAKQFTSGNIQRWSTLEVCKKIIVLNRTTEERASLRKRLRYEIWLSLRMGDVKLAVEFGKLFFA
jgi:glycosyltransferase involved in cell wall biosynthesis